MWIQISSGQGPEECELAVRHLLSDLTKQILKKGYEVTLIEASPGSIPGNLKSALLSAPSACREIIIPYCGPILWKCTSPYRPNHKRKNWFIQVTLLQEPEVSSFDERDVRFETLRSSGPGGQHVNKTESAVRAIHIPSGAATCASEERSQHQNKRLALARLAEQINTANQNRMADAKQDRWSRHTTLERGNAVMVFEGAGFKQLQARVLYHRE